MNIGEGCSEYGGHRMHSLQQRLTCYLLTTREYSALHLHGQGRAKVKGYQSTTQQFAVFSKYLVDKIR